MLAMFDLTIDGLNLCMTDRDESKGLDRRGSRPTRTRFTFVLRQVRIHVDKDGVGPDADDLDGRDACQDNERDHNRVFDRCRTVLAPQ